MAKVDVVITTYNLKYCIERSLNELLEQSFQNFRVIIIDDCSTDGTWEFLYNLSNEMPTKIFAFQTKENLGSPAKTRNAALELGVLKGDYVIFLDGDDSIESNFLERLYTRAVETNADMVICAYDRRNTISQRILCTEMKDFPKLIEMPLNSDLMAFVNGSLWNKLIKTSIISSKRIPDFHVGEDLSFLWMLYPGCKLISCVDEVLIHYLVRDNSVISNTQQEDIFNLASFLQERWGALEPASQEVFLLTIFIHIGLSMLLRASDNRSIMIRQHVRWTRYYFGQFNGRIYACPYLRLTNLKRHGLKGFGIWCCKILYEVKGVLLFLLIYKILRKILRKDFKF